MAATLACGSLKTLSISTGQHLLHTPRRHGYDFPRPDPNAVRPQRHAGCWSVIFSENRYPPRIKSGAGFFGIMLNATPPRGKASPACLQYMTARFSPCARRAPFIPSPGAPRQSNYDWDYGRAEIKLS
jgi:hypothetical protein